MEFLKELFGNESLTYEQLAAKVAEKENENWLIYQQALMSERISMKP